MICTVEPAPVMVSEPADPAEPWPRLMPGLLPFGRESAPPSVTSMRPPLLTVTAPVPPSRPMIAKAGPLTLATPTPLTVAVEPAPSISTVPVAPSRPTLNSFVDDVPPASRLSVACVPAPLRPTWSALFRPVMPMDEPVPETVTSTLPPLVPRLIASNGPALPVPSTSRLPPLRMLIVACEVALVPAPKTAMPFASMLLRVAIQREPAPSMVTVEMTRSVPVAFGPAGPAATVAFSVRNVPPLRMLSVAFVVPPAVPKPENTAACPTVKLRSARTSEPASEMVNTAVEPAPLPMKLRQDAAAQPLAFTVASTTPPADTVMLPLPQLPTSSRLLSPPRSMRPPVTLTVPLPVPPFASVMWSTCNCAPASAEKLPMAPAPTVSVLPRMS